MERKKQISETVPVQSIIPRELYAEFVKECAYSDYTIKLAIQFLIEEFVRHQKLCHGELNVTKEEYDKAFTAYEIYTTIRDDAKEKQSPKKKKRWKIWVNIIVT